MTWKVLRRSFKALKFEKGSPERYKLNKNSLTSEFARKKVWCVVDEKGNPLKSFEYIKDCKDFMENPESYKPKHKIKKYTREKFIQTKEYFERKKHNLKSSLKF